MTTPVNYKETTSVRRVVSVPHIVINTTKEYSMIAARMESRVLEHVMLVLKTRLGNKKAKIKDRHGESRPCVELEEGIDDQSTLDP
ncbi:hypothetical protein BM1_07440 [Bipolaris maydis]|nr:hypothetical protein BM1_07440 [Bipolaris maydis]